MLVRTLVRLRHDRVELRRGDHWYYSDAASYANRGVLVQRRALGGQATLVAVNFTDDDVTVPLTVPQPGTWTAQLPGGTDVTVPAGQQQINAAIPSNYGRLWTFG